MAPLSGDGTFFISSEDPDLDISFGQFGNGFWNPVLKFIFDSSCSDQLENGTKTLTCDSEYQIKWQLKSASRFNQL